MLKIKRSSTLELPWIAIPLKSHLVSGGRSDENPPPVSAGPKLQSTRPYSENTHHPVLKDPEPALPAGERGLCHVTFICSSWG